MSAEPQASRPQVMSVYAFDNGTTAVFDERGQQVPELQEPWLLHLVAFLGERGVDVFAPGFVLLLPGGRVSWLITPDPDSGKLKLSWHTVANEDA